MTENNQLVEQALAAGRVWLDKLRMDGNPDMEKIQENLAGRTFENKPLTAVYVVRSPQEAVDVLRAHVAAMPEGPDKERDAEVIKDACNCIWDYYLMAFYESSCGVLPEDERDFEGAEFIYQSMFPGFEAGLGFVITLGDVLVGVALPEAYRDDQFRLHRADGPAVTWGDMKVYWWHGVQIPGEWIEDKDSISPALCLTYPNIEQRRCLCEILEWEKVISHLIEKGEAKVVDEDKETYSKLVLKDEYQDLPLNEINSYLTQGKTDQIFNRESKETPRQLLEVNLPDSGTEKFLRVVCGTGRTFCIPVPRSMTTALEAAAATYGVSPEEYKGEVRA